MVQEAWDEAMPGIKFDMTNESHQWTWAQLSDRIAMENWEDLLYLPLTDL